MRIIYLHQHFSTPKGASGIRSYEMAQALLKQGHRVTMVCGSYGVGNTGLTSAFKNGKRRGTTDGIDVIEFDLSYSNADGFLKRTATFLKFSFGSIRIVLRESYDIAFATTTPLTVGIPSFFARIFRRKPVVFEVRDLWPELPRAMGAIKNPIILSAMSLLEWISYRTATRCIALSPGIRDGIAGRGVKPERIKMIPNGCDIRIFGDPDIEPWRPETVQQSDFMAVFTGTHGQANGLDAVLNAAQVLQKRNNNNIKIVLIGDGKLKAELQEAAELKGLDNVIFHSPVAKAKLASLMKSADLGLQCLANVPAFYYGTSPNKFFDYIAAGLPVLNNYPGWLADLITNNECGFAVPPDDPVAFADALESAAADRNLLKVRGANAARLAQNNFDRGQLADQWVDWVLDAKRMTN